jgi:hypothetical protein
MELRPPVLLEEAVPRFFFHVFDDAVSRDDEGLDLRDVEAARLEALAGIRGMKAPRRQSALSGGT